MKMDYIVASYKTVAVASSKTVAVASSKTVAVASSRTIAVASLLELSVRLRGREPNLRNTTSIHSHTSEYNSHKRKLSVRGRPDLSTPKRFRRLNGQHIVRCKKKDLKLIKTEPLSKLHKKFKQFTIQLIIIKIE
ncbi:hypothetical protein AVEN_60882-1 [Araneus ventricosus]|uniref:Uncharacterized protein n=1 Tax=Araneus ventricosus TaxID=182803 RepID=A0A4Y2WI41_ARAVE|nr:hypothetical protein AVEN_14456-1 [Araneus ventricosus]GBO36256.1 hypothetical protein AVEN_60882-1 [Araneus ventricosus]